jgi:hypothetical protein
VTRESDKKKRCFIYVTVACRSYILVYVWEEKKIIHAKKKKKEKK